MFGGHKNKDNLCPQAVYSLAGEKDIYKNKDSIASSFTMREVKDKDYGMVQS